MDIKGIEVIGQIFGLEDEAARTVSQTASENAMEAKEMAESHDTAISENADGVSLLKELTGIGGNNKRIDDSVDLNDIKETGTYCWTSSVPTNAPNSDASTMIVQRISSDTVVQLVVEAKAGNIYKRGMYGTWQSWVQLAVVKKTPGSETTAVTKVQSEAVWAGQEGTVTINGIRALYKFYLYSTAGDGASVPTWSEWLITFNTTGGGSATKIASGSGNTDTVSLSGRTLTYKTTRAYARYSLVEVLA